MKTIPKNNGTKLVHINVEMNGSFPEATPIEFEYFVLFSLAGKIDVFGPLILVYSFGYS